MPVPALALFGGSAALSMFSSYSNAKNIASAGRRSIANIQKMTAFNKASVLSEAAMQAQVAEFQGEYDYAVSKNKAFTANLNAARSREEAYFEAGRIAALGKKVEGSQRARAGKQGIRIEGSVEDVMYASAIDNEREALVRIYEGEVAATDFENQGRSYDAQGKTVLTMSKSSGSYIRAMGNRKAHALTLQSNAQISEIRNQIRSSKTNFWLDMFSTPVSASINYMTATGFSGGSNSIGSVGRWAG